MNDCTSGVELTVTFRVGGLSLIRLDYCSASLGLAPAGIPSVLPPYEMHPCNLCRLAVHVTAAS